MCIISQAYHDLICSLRVPWGLRKSQRMACIDSCMLSTAVASPCQTLCELLAGDHDSTSNARICSSGFLKRKKMFIVAVHFRRLTHKLPQNCSSRSWEIQRCPISVYNSIMTNTPITSCGHACLCLMYYRLLCILSVYKTTATTVAAVIKTTATSPPIMVELNSVPG